MGPTPSPSCRLYEPEAEGMKLRKANPLSAEKTAPLVECSEYSPYVSLRTEDTEGYLDTDFADCTDRVDLVLGPG